MKVGNGEVIAESNEGYKSRDHCEHGIALVKRDAADAAIENETTKT